MIGFIYKITNPKGRVYIGQTLNIEQRIYSYSSCNCKKQIRLYNSINKHGWKNHEFTILKICKIEELNIVERYYQDIFDVLSKKGLNCRLTGTNDKSGKLHESTLIKRKQYYINNPDKLRERTEKRMKTIAGKRRKGKTVIDENTGIIYDSIRLAAESLNIQSQRLTNMLTGVEPNITDVKYYCRPS